MTSNILIISPARSGSTSLRETLNSQPGILCHGEILGPNRILGISHKIKDTPITLEDRKYDRLKFTSTIIDHPGFSMTGFKALYGHFFLPSNAYYLNWTLSRSPKILFLWRRNLVARFKSECLLRLSGGNLKLEKFRDITVKEIEADAKLQMEMAGWIMQILKARGLSRKENLLTIDFEDLILNPDITKNILKFLGLDVERGSLGKDIRTTNNLLRQKEIEIPKVFNELSRSDLADTSLVEAFNWYSGRT